jgi:hypothetical protein
VQQHKEKNANTVERTNKKGRLVNEEFFKDLTGTITKIETKENEFGKQWQITFVDGDEKFMVQMPYSGRYSSSFLKALPNIEKGKPVRFMPWEIDDKNNASKKITGITMYQDQDGNGQTKILAAYTKEDQNGLPEMVKRKIKGKDTWDDTSMMEFLEEMAREWIASPVKAEEAGSEDAPF